MDIVPAEEVAQLVSLGELSLAGDLIGVTGALPAAITAAEVERDLFCPTACGAEAAWVGDTNVIAADSLLAMVNHFAGRAVLESAAPQRVDGTPSLRDLSDVKGQFKAKRALEVAAAGRHHILMVGAPGSGKSMLARRLPGILPPLSAAEALETSIIHSVAGLLDDSGILTERPFIDPHHTASVPAVVGGGRGAKPGAISLAHHGVLFLDELPEFPRAVLETLRQPLETGDVVISRANAHMRYPCRFMLVAAANPCRCGYMADAARACARVPHCGEDYMGKISGPLLDRFDIRIEVPQVPMDDFTSKSAGEPSVDVAARVAEARAVQAARFAPHKGVWSNADAEGELLDEIATPDDEGRALLRDVAQRRHMSARGYHRILRVARTIADLDGAAKVSRGHIAEAIGYRLSFAG